MTAHPLPPGNAEAPTPVVSNRGAPRVRRWDEQRWLIDNVIRSVGMEWDQPRLGGLLGSLGPESGPDIAGIRQRVQKFTDIAPAFEATARRREARAKAAEADGEPIVARDNYFMAANYWCSAQWPVDENNAQNLFYNARKRDCYMRYAALADHPVAPAWIPFRGKALPGWFHLPPGYQGGRIPLVVSIPGMDGFKERFVPLAGDRWLARGVAVLTFEGPGQTEAAVLDIHVSTEAWAETGRALMAWIRACPEIDPEQVGIVGSSFGSFFSTIAFANEPGFRACAVSATCLEPGCATIFEEASPSYKKRFMYMAGHTDEAAFDDFRPSLTWEGHSERIGAPYLCVAGELDELSPLAHAERMFEVMTAPRRLVIYQGARHGPAGVPSTNLGPFFPSLIAEWMTARFAGKPFASERWFVDAAGQVGKTAYTQPG
jgi:dienelactone hydrolase